MKGDKPRWSKIPILDLIYFVAAQKTVYRHVCIFCGNQSTAWKLLINSYVLQGLEGRAEISHLYTKVLNVSRPRPCFPLTSVWPLGERTAADSFLHIEGGWSCSWWCLWFLATISERSGQRFPVESQRISRSILINLFFQYPFNIIFANRYFLLLI